MNHDHSSHGHGNTMEPMCNMNMLFTWDTTDLCIVFRSWHIRSNASLIFSLLAVAALTAGYELIREAARRYETGGAASPSLTERDPRDIGNGGSNGARKSKMVKGLLYAVQVFYSFFIMLLFMTYNGWVMLAVAVGAFAGYMLFGSNSSGSSKSVACH